MAKQHNGDHGIGNGFGHHRELWPSHGPQHHHDGNDGSNHLAALEELLQRINKKLKQIEHHDDEAPPVVETPVPPVVDVSADTPAEDPAVEHHDDEGPPVVETPTETPPVGETPVPPVVDVSAEMPAEVPVVEVPVETPVGPIPPVETPDEPDQAPPPVDHVVIDPVPSSGALQYEGANLPSGAFDDPVGMTPKYGENFIYPANEDIQYLHDQGMNTVNISFHMQHMFTEADGIDDFAALKELVEYADGLGMTAVLRAAEHGLTSTNQEVGKSDAANQQFASDWGRVAEAFKGYDNVVFTLDNEPFRVTAEEYLPAINQAIAAIRDTGAEQKLVVSGAGWQSAWGWMAESAEVLGPGVVDPLNNFAFGVHWYGDQDGSGTGATLAGTEDRLFAATDWARANGHDLFLDEWGFEATDTGMEVGKAVNDYIHANSDVWIGATVWSSGPWWGDYPLSIQPHDDGTPREQWQVLDDHLV